MTTFPYLDGISARTVLTPRLRAQILTRDIDTDDALRTIVFVHGNVSSSLFWQPFMLALPDTLRAVAIDLRGFGGSEILPVNATRGLRDFSDDVASVLDHLSIADAHLVGWSMGGGVVLQLALDRPDLVRTLTLQAPVSPYGFGGTDLQGNLITPDGAGTGGGGANPDFVASLRAHDTGEETPTAPRNVYRTAYVSASHRDEYEDIWVESMLTTATGPDNYPGDSSPSDAWPGFAPGDHGVLNTMAPTRCNLTAIVDLERKPPILWIHGDSDAIVSDTSFFDLNYLGQLGVIPGWPGEQLASPQPMVSQTRRVLERYRAQSGEVTELLLEGVGHAPHVERLQECLQALLAHCERAERA